MLTRHSSVFEDDLIGMMNTWPLQNGCYMGGAGCISGMLIRAILLHKILWCPVI